MKTLGLFLLIVSASALLACGGIPRKPGTYGPVGFVNKSIVLTDSDLQELWAQAQQAIATGPTQINTREILFNPNAQPRFIPGDSRALTVESHMLVIEAVPDVPATVLNAKYPNSFWQDPTGEIECPTSCPPQNAVAQAYTLLGIGVQFAASTPTPELKMMLVYEFQNQILYQLGYDTKYR